MKKILIFTIVLLMVAPSQTSATIIDNVRGKILLQVEANGEAWYVNPDDNKRHFLGRPDDAFALMRNFGLGITNTDLNKIPIGLLNLSGKDSDTDGIINAQEQAMGTDAYKADTDGDGFSDYNEVINGYSPLVKLGDRLIFDQAFTNRLKGKILLQVESFGEAWYVNPSDGKRYFLSRPADAFAVMRELGVGITNANLEQIPQGTSSVKILVEAPKPIPSMPEPAEDINDFLEVEPLRPIDNEIPIPIVMPEPEDTIEELVPMPAKPEKIVLVEQTINDKFKIEYLSDWELEDTFSDAEELNSTFDHIREIYLSADNEQSLMFLFGDNKELQDEAINQSFNVEYTDGFGLKKDMTDDSGAIILFARAEVSDSDIDYRDIYLPGILGVLDLISPEDKKEFFKKVYQKTYLVDGHPAYEEGLSFNFLDEDLSIIITKIRVSDKVVYVTGLLTPSKQMPTYYNNYNEIMSTLKIIK